MAEYYVDDEVRLAQQFLSGFKLPAGVRVVARPGKNDGETVVQLTCHGAGGTRAVRRDALGVWSNASEAEKDAMIRGLLADLPAMA